MVGTDIKGYIVVEGSLSVLGTPCNEVEVI